MSRLLPEASLISHLEALRQTLLTCLTATALCYPAGYMMAPEAIDLLLNWCFPGNGGNLYYFSPLEVFWVHLRTGFFLAIMLACPYILFQIWRFVLPALYRHEKKPVLFWSILSVSLFLSGMAFSILAVLPLVTQFAISFSTSHIHAMIGLENFLYLAGMMMLACGIMFQMPVIVFILIRSGLVSRQTLAGKRPFIMTGILIAAAVLTPPDVLSQLLLAVPSWLLFELGLFLASETEPAIQNTFHIKDPDTTVFSKFHEKH